MLISIPRINKLSTNIDIMDSENFDFDPSLEANATNLYDSLFI